MRSNVRSTIRHSGPATCLLAFGILQTAPLAAQSLPEPSASGINHIVVVMMENRSFDHMLGWVPKADGIQDGLVYTDAAGVAHATYPLAPDYQGCSHPDPDHSYEGGRIEFNNGACDGWLRAGKNDEFAIGYYKKNDLKFYREVTKEFLVCDRYFSSILSETWPNRVYQFCGQTDRIDNSFFFSTLPTIWDRLAAANVSARYYFNDVPFVALWGLQYLPISRPFSFFLADAAAGTLPAVSFVDPRFLEAESGTSHDDHPHADVRNGQAFLEQVYRAVTTGPSWPNTLLVINYDEWGGFFDHVPPPLAEIPPADQLVGNDGRLGFRVPCIVVSPHVRRGSVSSIPLEHCSILRMIEWRWNLPPLTVRDANARNLAEVLDFSVNRLTAPQFNVPAGPFGAPCFGTPPPIDKWGVLFGVATILGWF